MPASNHSGNLRVVLVDARNPLNIGAAARAMSNFGFGRLRVVSPYDAAYREARSAVGAAEVLANAEEFKTVAEAIADCTLVVGTTAVRHRELQHPLRRLESGARILRRRLTSERVALLFGSERFGLSNQDLSHCHWLLNIPTREEHISMNLGQAVAVCLYELIRDGKAEAKIGKEEIASSGEMERFSALLTEALDGSGYMSQGSTATAQEKLRRLVRRLQLPARDAEVWLGILRQMSWKIKSAGAAAGKKPGAKKTAVRE